MLSAKFTWVVTSGPNQGHAVVRVGVSDSILNLPWLLQGLEKGRISSGLWRGPDVKSEND